MHLPSGLAAITPTMFSFPALSLRQTCLFSSQLYPSIVASVSTFKRNYHALGREERIEIRVDSSEIIPASTSVRAAFLLDGQLGPFWENSLLFLNPHTSPAKRLSTYFRELDTVCIIYSIG